VESRECSLYCAATAWSYQTNRMENLEGILQLLITHLKENPLFIQASMKKNFIENLNSVNGTMGNWVYGSFCSKWVTWGLELSAKFSLLVCRGEMLPRYSQMELTWIQSVTIYLFFLGKLHFFRYFRFLFNFFVYDVICGQNVCNWLYHKLQ